ncbi:MAG: bifunctional adenosylcobinamide kinase/adenosylcobinamide-phosphate guanylyltransferase [Clostridia bacterium]|nr:bifunctional adenosylcobinamide kinase/adenosylcobinamide-phosphate guanylyltransferase [Clostridia bacterium]
MDFIIGGAYQGKLDYAKKQFGVTDEQIFTCSETDGIRFGARCIHRLEEFTLWSVRNGKDATEIFKGHESEWRGSVLICCDIFCGVVPMGADMRTWREMTGRLCAYLSGEAESVTRLFCGLPQRLA